MVGEDKKEFIFCNLIFHVFLAIVVRPGISPKIRTESVQS